MDRRDPTKDSRLLGLSWTQQVHESRREGGQGGGVVEPGQESIAVFALRKTRLMEPSWRESDREGETRDGAGGGGDRGLFPVATELNARSHGLQRTDDTETGLEETTPVPTHRATTAGHRLAVGV